MRLNKHTLFCSLLLISCMLKLQAQEKHANIGLKSGVGVYSQVVRLFVSNELNSEQIGGSNPNFKSKILSGIGYFSSFEYQFNTGYKMNIGYDLASLKQYYNDQLGFFWDDSYLVDYRVLYISFSKALSLKKFSFHPEIGVIYREINEDYTLFEYQIIDENNIQFDFPAILNKRLSNFGVKLAVDCRFHISNSFSLGIRLASDVINFKPETFLISPFISVNI